ncbi:MAG: hypothetical protein ACREYE_28260 [Gammaproteobacteria bacterium]
MNDTVENEVPAAGENAPAVTAGDDSPEFVMPEKFRGKTMEDIVQSYMNVEQSLGRSRNEVGELRKLSDSLIQRGLQNPPPQAEDFEETDFFEDPKAAVEKAVQEALKKRLAPVEDSIAQARQRTVRDTLMAQHPDLQDIISSQEFQSWVQKSNIRMKLYDEADRHHDFDAADELLSTYKALHMGDKAPTPPVSDRQAVNVRTRRAATLEGSGTSSVGKTILRRTDLMRMRTSDPDRYIEMQDEILAAYREGRVR